MGRLKRISALVAGLLAFVLLAAVVSAAHEDSYRSQLDGDEMQIYDGLLENLERQAKSFSCTFSPPLQYQDEKEAQAGVQSISFRAYEAFYRDHPEIFWVDKDGGMSIQPDMSQSAGGYTVRGITVTTKLNDESRITQKQQELESAVASLLAQATGSDYERLVYVHDALVEKCAYSMQAKADPARYPDAYEAYGALVSGSAVCEGYSKAMKLLCDRMGIPCVLVGGNANGEAHMWNYVRLDGAYYLLDATFDDPVGGSPTKDYFLKGSASSSEHRPGGGFLQGFQSNFTDPALSQNDYQPGQSAASPAAENREEQKKSCRVRYSGSAGGSYEVAFGGSVGPVDNGQSVEGGSVVSVWALPAEGYALEEIRVEMGGQVITETNKNEIYVKVTDDCQISVQFSAR